MIINNSTTDPISSEMYARRLDIDAALLPSTNRINNGDTIAYYYAFTTSHTPVSMSYQYITGAFINCVNMISVSMDNVRYIGSYAFTSCHALKSIYAPLCKSFGVRAFQNCYNLEIIDFPVLSIGGYSMSYFNGYSDSANTIIYQTNILYDPFSITGDFGYGALGINSCYRLKEVHFPECIYAPAFTDCFSLSVIDMEKVRYIYDITNDFELSSIYFSTAVTGAFRRITFSDYESCISMISADPFHSKLRTIFMTTGGEYTTCNLKSNYNLMSISLPSFKGYLALYNNYKLNSFYLPEGFVTSPISSCYNLSVCNYPKAKYVVGPISNCYNLKEYSVPEVVSVYQTNFFTCLDLERVAFPKCSIIFGQAVSYSGRYSRGGAFEYCLRLQSVDAPLCVSLIKATFNACYILKDINMSLVSSINAPVMLNNYAYSRADLSNVIQIETWDFLFKSCNNLEYINLTNCSSLYFHSQTYYIIDSCCNTEEVILNSNVYLGAGTGGIILLGAPYCYLLKNTIYPSLISTRGNTVISQYIQCSLIKSAIFENVRTAGYGAFASCTRLSNVYMPSCASINGIAFAWCDSLRSVTNEMFPICSYISSTAFYDCYNLSYASLDSCITLGTSNDASGVFGNCIELESVCFLNCITVGNRAFAGCVRLESVSLPICSQMYSYTFMNCKSLSYICLPSCSSFGAYPFYGCDLLIDETKFSLPMINFASIPNAFFGYTGLETFSMSICISIGANAFQGCSKLSLISFPLCKSIYNGAFSGCSSLYSVVFPSCLSVSDNAFANCIDLTDVILPECTYIAANAFSNCSNLQNINCPKLLSIQANTFSRNSSISYIYFPSCTAVGNYAFYSCNNLEEVSLPVCNTVGVSAFQYCSNLREVLLPACTSIQAGIFTGCNSLENIYLPALQSVAANTFANLPNLVTIQIELCSTVSSGAFNNCYKLNSIVLDTVNYKIISNNTFYNCSSLSEIYFPNVTNIYNYAFYNCISLEYASFSKCLTIGSNTFQNCYSLNSVSFPLCTTIGSNAFQNCSNLSIVSLPVCTIINNNAFQNCIGIEELNLSVFTNIRSNIFAGCTSLNKVMLPSVTAIPSNTFNGFSNLEIVYIPLCSTISSGTFNNCYKLTNITVNSSNYKIISNNTFYNCSNLSEVSFPACTSVYNNAFYNCISLKSISFPLCTGIGNSAFRNCSSLSGISLPICTTIGSNAFQNCYELATVSLPNVRTIRNSAFNNCSNLQYLYLTSGTVVTLNNANAFAGTPISISTLLGDFGSIYVPESLVNNYKTAKNWSAYSNRIVGI